MIRRFVSGIIHIWWIFVLIVIGIVILYSGIQNCALWKDKDCTGFLGQTIWDWLDLAIIPITLIIVGFILDSRERKADRENIIEIQHETILQNYF